MIALLNLIGVAGYGALLAGIYVSAGLGTTLISGGSMALLFALVALSKRSRPDA